MREVSFTPYLAQSHGSEIFWSVYAIPLFLQYIRMKMPIYCFLTLTVSYMGNFTANIRDMHEDYIRPQENGSHFGCRHMTVSDGRINLRFTAENDFSFNASEYTEEELAAKRHNFELQKCESNVICVDSQMAGVGSNSRGPALAEKYRLSLPNISAKLHMEILG